jgi:hypothetical protein
VDQLITPGYPKEMQEQILKGLLNLFNSPKNRSYLRDMTEFTKIFTLLTTAEINNKQIQHKILPKLTKQFSMLKDVIVIMMRHWCGIIFMCQESEGPSTLRSLIEALNQPIHELKKLTILDSFIEVFNLNIMNLHLIHKTSIVQNNLQFNYVAFTLLTFIHNGIYEALV